MKPVLSVSAESIRARMKNALMIAAVLFVGWHLASFVSLLQEIRDRIQDHNVIIDLNIEEKRIDDATPIQPTRPKPTQQFWRGT